MISSPRVSVILLSYNHAEFLDYSISSILKQSFKDFELIVVDDCSSDSSWEIIQKYALSDSRVNAIRHDHNICCGVIESAMPFARGEMVSIAHSDDGWAPTKLEKQVDYLDSHPNIDACFTRVCVIGDNNIPLEDNPSYASHPYLSVFEQENRTRTEWLRFFFFNGNAFCHPSLLIRKRCYREYGLFPHGLGSFPDFQEWIRLCSHSEPYVIDERLTFFRVHADESNSSGQNVGSICRQNTEMYLLLPEYLSISQDDFLDAFPETRIYLVNGEIDLRFAFARLCIDKSTHPAYRLFGLQLLYALLQDGDSRARIDRLYGYTEKKYDREKRLYDIFGLVQASDTCCPKLYWDLGNGFSEGSSAQKDVYITASKTIDVAFSIPRGAKAIRFDPDDGQFRKVRIRNADADGAPLDFVPVNGLRKTGGYVTFLTTDPQYYASLDVEASLVHIVFEIETVDDARISSAIESLETELEDTRNEVNKLQGLLDNTLRSRVRRLFRRE